MNPWKWLKQIFAAFSINIFLPTGVTAIIFNVSELSVKEREHVGQELSDVLIYLLDLSARCHIDLPAAAMAKMTANAKKYPVSKAYGKANKYTDYQEKPNSEIDSKN